MTTNILEFLETSFSYSFDANHLKLFLESCIEHGAFYCKDNTDTVVKTINSSLNSSFDKERGLILLNVFLLQTSEEAFANNAVSWMNHCNKTTHQKGGIIDSLRLKVLAQLIKLSVKFPEVNKETSKQIVPKFLTDHVRCSPGSQVTLELLECLRVCMTEYSGPAGEFKADILKVLLSTVEAKPKVIQAAAQCFPLVASLGGGGKQGVSHKAAWHSQQLALVTLLHALLNKIYEHINCLTDADATTPADLQLKLPPVSEKNVLCRTQRLTAQFTAISQFLQAMLLEEFPVAKLVSPDPILDVISHAQKPTQTGLGSSQEALAVSAVLPTIQSAAVRLLESLVLCLGRNLLPQGGLVGYLCCQLCVWSHLQQVDWPWALEKPFSRTRMAAYCCLCSWLSVAGTGSQVDSLLDKLLPILLADISLKKPTIRLKMSRTGKGKRKQDTLVSLKERGEKLGVSVGVYTLCQTALTTLELLVKSAGSSLQVDLYQEISDTVLSVVTELPVPYSDPGCQGRLYQLLLTLCLEPHPRAAPPWAAALAVFTAGAHHPAPQVKAVCSSALTSLESIIHPTAATLYFPVPGEKQRSLFREWREEIEEEPPKRRKLDTSDNDPETNVSVMLENNSINPSSVVSVTSEEKEDTECSSDSVKIIETSVEDLTVQYLTESTLEKDYTEEVVEDEPHNDEEINIPHKTPNAGEINIQEQINGNKIPRECKFMSQNYLNIDERKNLLAEKDQESYTSNKDTVTDIGNCKESTEEIQCLPDEQDVGSADDTTLPKTEESDVSLMLMDFRDEVDGS